MPFFSVIIPTYNRYRKLRNAIDSVLNQTFTDYEVLVIDDGSTDQTPDLADSYRRKIQYHRQENCGVSSARNTGIRLSDAPCICLLDSDDLWLERKLETQYRFIQDNPNINIHQTDEIWIRNDKRVNPMKKHKKKSGEIFEESLRQCMISPSSVVLKRELFEQYGIFDERLPACEDYDLWLRITAHEPVGLIDEKLIVKHGGHTDQLSRKYWGMDRFRIYAIARLLAASHKALTEEHLNEACSIGMEKCSILSLGARKRDRQKFALRLKGISDSFGMRDYNNIDCDFLLEE